MSYDLRKYSPEKLLDELKKYYIKNQKVPTARDFNPKLGHTDQRLYKAMFGSWNNALKLANLEINKKYNEITDEEMINILHKYYNETGKIPTKSQFVGGSNIYPHHNNYLYRFGSWSKALKLAGFDVDNLILTGQVNVKSFESYKGRLFELNILNSFNTDGAVDCSGNYCGSSFDGICPKGYRYDAKSSKLYSVSKYAKGWQFAFNNKNKELIQYYILGAFDEKFEKLLFVWMFPGEFFKEKNHITIMYNKIYRLEKYNITNKCNWNIITEKENVSNYKNNVIKEVVNVKNEISKPKINKQKNIFDY